MELTHILIETSNIQIFLNYNVPYTIRRITILLNKTIPIFRLFIPYQKVVGIRHGVVCNTVRIRLETFRNGKS